MRHREYGWRLCLLICAMWFVGCTSSRQVRKTRPVTYHKPPIARPAPTTPAVQKPQLPPPPTAPLAMIRSFGQRVLARGEALRQRAQMLHQRCNAPDAPRRLCQVYWRSQRIFASYYRTKRTNYRGYMMVYRRKRWRIPRSLRGWFKRMSNAKYKGQGGACFIDRGLSSSCMGFAMCAVRGALQEFAGPWGKGFVYPTMGYVNYWTSEAYYAAYFDRRRGRGTARWGIGTFLRRRHTLSPTKQRQVARRLAGDVHRAFMRIVRKKRRHPSVRRLFRKLFCTNIVSGMGAFSKAQPGDLFAISYAYKRSRRGRVRGFRFQHWGIVASPAAGKVLHNQTPGGMWGRKFSRWGIQYGHYTPAFTNKAWTWKRRKRRYEKRVVFYNRLNAHFYVYARQRGVPIYSRNQPNLCKDWIAQHGEVYLGVSPAAPPLATPTQPQLLSLR